MALQKQSLNINFSQGLDLKTDPNQVQPGKFLVLENSIFTKGGLLQKRNGFAQLPSLPDTTYQYINTFNGNLTAIGPTLSAFSDAANDWIDKGSITPIQMETLSLIRSGSNQSQVDSVVASNGLVCTVYTNDSPSTSYRYVIADSVTGQNIVAPTVLVTPSESPRVFLLGNYFIILYSESANLNYIAIPINDPSHPGTEINLINNYSAGMDALAFDGVVANNNLYVAYNGSDMGGAIRMTFLNSFLVRQTANTGVNIDNGQDADIISICADVSTPSPIIWTMAYLDSSNEAYVIAVDGSLTSVLTETKFNDTDTILNMTGTAQNQTISVFYEIENAYSYGTPLPTNYIKTVNVTQAAVVGSVTTLVRSVGLASKAFLMSGVSYMLTAYQSDYQPSYFLVNGDGDVAAKLAYSNGGGYLTQGLPSVTITDTLVQIPYLIKDLIVAANKSQNPSSNKPVFTQTGINLASFDFTTDGLVASEIGSNLNISGGLLWTYDGYQVVEQGFNVYPDNVIVTTATTGGSLANQTYYYAATYEWTDNQGNIHRSAPSLAVQQVTTGSGASTNTVKIPTLRLTYKTANPVKIVIYRWSTAQQIYYQVTSLTSPVLNSTTVDNISFSDTFADSAIVGNSILYTTGGVVENISAPPTKVTTLFRSRLFLVDSEDQNLLWYSKQVIEGTPVEFSDLFTLFVAPTISAQGDTGPIRALSTMDDKLIIFKDNAIYYLTGNGPDNAGANNDFSEPVFITGTVGCSNQNSIVFIPQGLMFQSDKGIWLLGRDLSTTYIGAPVEDFNSSLVLSSLTIPGTNQARFTLNTGEVLMYDYFYAQWGTFTGVPSISSTLFEGLHTFINSYGACYQESLGAYLDGSNPVLVSFTTSWLNLSGLQGFERAYFFYLLGTYVTPHKLTVQIAYDYQSTAVQTSVITPDNYNGPYGNDPIYGSGDYGGNSTNMNWRVFLAKQKCESFQISVTESFDSSFGVPAGAGFTLSGIDLVIGMKGGWPRLQASRSVG